MFITSFEEQNITYRSCSNLRIHLLAKFAPADKHKGDAHVPTPTFNITHGVAWQITETEWIIRKELSDEMLELLEKIFKETKTE